MNMGNKTLQTEITNACLRIAPAWSLENIVAVNPYLGLSDLNFNEAAHVLSERAGIQMGMPKQFYLNKIETGQITKSDIENALEKNNTYKLSADEFLKEVKFLSVLTSAHKKFKAQTILDLSEKITTNHWNDFMIENVSNWASAHFDKFQALWKTSKSSNDLFQSWKQDAEVDLSPEIMGIKNFRSILKKIPNNHPEATNFLVEQLQIPQELQEAYFHTLLLKTIGWSSYVRSQDWDNSLIGNTTTQLNSFLTIILCWEYCMHESFKSSGIQEAWALSKTKLINRKKTRKKDEYLKSRMVLQDAYDFSCQREIAENFNQHNTHNQLQSRPNVQAIFCIDVRSEIYRRNLEKVDQTIETIGFAGFFGFPINYKPIAHTTGHNLCPALIPAGIEINETLGSDQQTEKAKVKRTRNHQFSKVWKNFKSGAISGFSFVSPLGLSYLPKLISDSYGITRPVKNPKTDGIKALKKGQRDLDLSSISMGQKVDMAAGALSAMGISNNMAKLVLITGHGSSSVNNPHATSYDCGACGGHSGEINAMTAERILNDVSVRINLKHKGIKIPADTHFSACLHNTTTDNITIINEEKVPDTHKQILIETKKTIISAGIEARKERSAHLGINSKNFNEQIVKRTSDWSQVRPEWGLAGCNSFVIAPRNRTKGMNLGGQSFLQSYDYKNDPELKILESIMTAPMVVTSWINLQYYASTTDNKRLGSGNKTLHNITAGIGVLEGSTGDLRIGLPIQAVHNGTEFQHSPNRINVLIEAPIEAINQILNNHPNIKELADNSWITLLHINADGKVTKRYTKNCIWSDLTKKKKTEKELLTV